MWVVSVLRFPAPTKRNHIEQLVASMRVWRQHLEHTCPALLLFLEPQCAAEIRPLRTTLHEQGSVVQTRTLTGVTYHHQIGCVLRVLPAGVPMEWFLALAGVESAVDAMVHKAEDSSWRGISTWAKFLNHWCVTPKHRQRLGMVATVQLQQDHAWTLRWRGECIVLTSLDTLSSATTLDDDVKQWLHTHMHPSTPWSRLIEQDIPLVWSESATHAAPECVPVV
jgi:hypothetical protein